jgi:predicted transcriptional regulator
MILTRLEKEQLVLDLHNQGKGTREIAREVKISFSQIGAILKRAAQQREVGQVQAERTSISTQAYELFSEGRTALQVTIDLKMKADEAIDYQKEYWNLQQLNTLHQVYDVIKDDIWSFVELYKLIKDAGTDQKQVKRLLEIANNDLPRVEELYKNLCREVERLTFEKLGAAETIQELNNEVMHLSKTVECHKSECQEQESKKRILYLKKIRLESVIQQLQKSPEYDRIVQVVKQQMKNVIGEDKQLLKLAFDSLIESLLRDPFRLQSLFEYAMSSASALTSSYAINDNIDHDGKPCIYSQYYLSPDHEGDHKQVEYLRNLILNESEKFYHKQIEELTNMAISEAAAHDDKNQLLPTYDEKRSIRRLLLLGFTESK